MNEAQFENLYSGVVPAQADSVQGLDILSIVEFGLLIMVVALCAGILLTLRKERGKVLPEKAEELIAHAEEQANSIIIEATQEARDLRAEIEKHRVRALAEDRTEVERFLEAYSTRLDRTIKELSYGIEKEHMRASSSFVETLQNIEKRVAGEATEAKRSMDSFTSQSSALFERLAIEIENVEKGIQHLAVALEEAAANESDKNAEIVREEMRTIGKQTARAVTEVAKGLDEVLRKNLEREFASISKEIEKYRSARMELVDERILVLLEETAQIALSKQVSMADQSEFVYRALEEAKERGVFV